MRTLTTTPFWTTRSLYSNFWSDMDDLFDRSATASPSTERSFSDHTEVNETSDHYLLSVDLPGVKKEDLKINFSDGLLTLMAERKGKSQSYGVIKRSFRIPQSVEVEQIEASYEDGVLELYLPKKQSARPRQIEIQAAPGGFFERLLSSKKSPAEVKDLDQKPT